MRGVKYPAAPDVKSDTKEKTNDAHIVISITLYASFSICGFYVFDIKIHP